MSDDRAIIEEIRALAADTDDEKYRAHIDSLASRVEEHLAASHDRALAGTDLLTMVRAVNSHKQWDAMQHQAIRETIIELRGRIEALELHEQKRHKLIDELDKYIRPSGT